MNDRVGSQVGNYRLISHLGQGGFAEVYLGEHIYLRSKAAIKLMNTQLSEIHKDHFLEEARFLVNLIHPHIVRVLDFGVEGETPLNFPTPEMGRYHSNPRNTSNTGRCRCALQHVFCPT